MTGPGGDQVGKVSIRVVPDTSGFRRDLKRELEEIEKSLKLKIPVELGDIDTAGLKAQLEALEKSKVTIPVDLGDGTEIERLRARLQALENAQVDIPVEFDPRGIERIEAVVRRLNGRSIRMNVRLNGVNQAIRGLTAIDALVRRLDGRRINIGIDVDAGAAIAQIAAIEAALIGVRASLGSIGSSAGGPTGAFGRMGSAVMLAVGALVLLPPLATAIAVAGAAITAAWGAAATAVAALPAALFLVGVPLGLLMLSFEELGKTIKKVTPAFQEFRKQTAKAFAEGFAPAMEAFATKVLPKVQGSVTNIARTMGQLAQQAVDWLATTQGTELLNAVLVNIDTTLKSMSFGLGNVGRAFLELAAQASTFDVLSTAINEFGASFRSHVVDLIGSGTLDTAMRGLRDMLVELGQGFSDLVHNGIELFAAAAPGVNKFLDSLSKFFNRFNWNSLGNSVGGVFRGLGEALDEVPTDTFRKIEEGFDKLSKTFQSPEFKKGVKDLVDSLPAAIELVDKFAKAFGPLASEVGGAIRSLNDIGNSAKDALTKVKEFSDWIDTQLFGSPVEVPEEFKSPLQKWIESWLGDTGEQEGKAEDAGERIAEGFQRGLDGIEPQFGGVGDGWLPDIGKWVEDWFGSDDTDLDKPLEDLKTKIKDGLAPLSEIARQAMEQVKLMVQTGLTELLPIVTLGLVGVQTAFTNGWLAIGASTSLAMNTLVNTLTLGFTLMQTAVANGMLLLQTAFITGWALVQLAVDNGLLLMRTAVNEGFLQMQTDAANGMLLFAAAVLAGFAVVVPAVNVGMAQIVLAVQVGFQQIVSAVQTGMQQVTEALQLNWSTAVSATQAAMQQMAAAVQVGMSNIGVYVQDGMQRSVDAVTAGMDQMKNQVQRGMSDAEAHVRNGIARMVAALNAARSQFFSAGANMGQALADGLNSKAGAVEAAARRLANAAAAAVRAAAAIRSPSRVFIEFGELMGEGLAIGLRTGSSEAVREADRMTRAVVASVSGIQDVLAADTWATDFNARVNTELATQDAADPVVGELRALRGDAAQPLWAAQLIAELRGLRRDVTTARAGAAATAQADRRAIELGAFI